MQALPPRFLFIAQSAADAARDLVQHKGQGRQIGLVHALGAVPRHKRAAQHMLVYDAHYGLAWAGAYLRRREGLLESAGGKDILAAFKQLQGRIPGVAAKEGRARAALGRNHTVSVMLKKKQAVGNRGYIAQIVRQAAGHDLKPVQGRKGRNNVIAQA